MNAPKTLALQIKLPTADRRLETFTLSEPRAFPAKQTQAFNRVAFAAAHVVADPLSTKNPWVEAEIDWDATLAFRRHLWSLGFGVAEAMDTAQRGMGLDWPTSLKLIQRSIHAARDIPGAFLASGAGTDHLPSGPEATIDDVIVAYEEQFAAVEKAGGRIIMMASRALAACATSADDYYRVYAQLLRQAREPVIIHWLGEMFDPALAGYWGHDDHYQAMEVALNVIQANAAKVDGIKISLLDKQKEIDMRRRLPANVKMYTGDDFNYAELIEGDSAGYSDALLGIFDAIAPAASAALSASSPERSCAFSRDPRAYSTALPPHFRRADALLQNRRRVPRLAQRSSGPLHHDRRPAQHAPYRASRRYLPPRNRAGLLRDPELACQRMRQVLALHGLEK